jgi:hypothetical protein
VAAWTCDPAATVRLPSAKALTAAVLNVVPILFGFRGAAWRMGVPLLSG